MKREWKPGDVAMVNDTTRPDAPWDAATCTAVAIPGEREAVWLLHESGARVWGSVSEARPLVVIDPEDREQVERLAREYVKTWSGVFPDPHPETVAIARRQMQAALREFANPMPPKPEEPTGLGAVVEDADGNRWVRREALNYPWGQVDHWRKWSEIAAVRVLSEGVTA